ncbi:MAG: hypothetical protein M4579_007258, partial [Chaenotheca gracillima]
MSLQIFIAHTGERLRADPVSFSSLDDLRSWISSKVAVPVAKQILITTRGKQVKLPMLLTEKEVFVYDRSLISPSSTSKTSPPDLLIPDPFSPKDPPDTLSSPTDLQAWQDLFMARRSWALEIAERCAPLAEEIKSRVEEATIIERAVGIAAINLDTHVTGLEQRYNDAKAWAAKVSDEHGAAAKDWQSSLVRLEKIPANEGVLAFIASRRTGPRMKKLRDGSSTRGRHLSELVDAEDVRKASRIARELSTDLEERLTNMGATVENILSRSQALADEVHRQGEAGSMGELNEHAAHVIEDVEVVAKKVSSDYEHVLGLQPTSKSVSQASKMALLHTRNYLPSLMETGSELGQLHQQAIKQRHGAAQVAIQHLQTISVLESTLATVNPQLSNLDLTPQGIDAFDVLSLVSRLPFLYGSVLVEIVRRKEWSERIKVDSSNLAEELAAYKDEEERRRRKWRRTVSALVSNEAGEEHALAVEVNLQSEAQSYPSVQRQDVEEYMRFLRGIEGMQNVAQEIAQQLAELDRPTRQQNRRAKAFKGGSVHESVLGKSSLLLRGEDELIRSLRDDKTKVEDRLKGSESRVRKLEDLLHRQSQYGRSNNASPFQPQNGQSPEQQQQGVMFNPSSATASPRPSDESRRPSTSSRRFSANQSAQEKTLAQRMLSLEAELMAEREHTAGLQKEAAARHETQKEIQGRIDDATSVKNDLLENLDAQQREFTDERRHLEAEIAQLKNKLEQNEDEIDRIMGSRDHEKMAADQRIHTLETELGTSHQHASEDLKKLREKFDSLTTENQTLKGTLEGVESESDHARREKGALEERLRDLELQRQQDQDENDHRYRTLRDVHEQISPDRPAPERLAGLIEAIAELARRSVSHLRDVEHALAIAQADKEEVQSKADEAEKEASTARNRFDAEEKETANLRETLSREQGVTESLKAELEDAEAEIRSLRDRFADGETGSGSLKDRLVEEEAKVKDLSARLSANSNEVQTLHDELRAQNETTQTAKSNLDSMESRLETRTTQAKDLSQRLYAQNDRLRRLLETLGFTVAHRDEGMIIQRISRTGTSSLTEADPTSSLRRSISGATNPTEDYATDFDLLYWTNAADPDTLNTRHSDFLTAIDKFDLDAFSEAITKRLKETEHMARKWQKEARSYRDKAHRAHAEAHDKIAFHAFKDGDLALFLPTRNQATRPWAAFNVGAPHYFLREQDSHKLRSRDWLLARISKVEERVVDLSRSMNGGRAGVPLTAADRRSISSDGAASFDDENPFELSDGLRWYLLDAAEEKPGAPSTPGLGKSTVASAHVDAKGSVRVASSKKSVFGSVGGGGSGGGAASKTLSKSLDSRRSSSTSKKGMPPPALPQQGSSSYVTASSDLSRLSPAKPRFEAALAADHTPDAPSSASNDQPAPTATAVETQISTAAGAGTNHDHSRPTSRSPTKQYRPQQQLSTSTTTSTQSSPSKSIPRTVGENGAAAPPPGKRLWDSLFSLD